MILGTFYAQKVAVNKYYRLTDTGPYNRPIRYWYLCDRQYRLIGRYELIGLISKLVVHCFYVAETCKGQQH